MNSLLYEAAVQVVPLLLIAFFLDRRIQNDETTARARRWRRWSNKFSLLLNAIAFDEDSAAPDPERRQTRSRAAEPLTGRYASGMQDATPLPSGLP